MPRIRTIKPEFFRSPDTARVSFPVRLFYQALWCWADDFGIGETNIYGLLGFAFCDEDGFTAQDLRQFCADVAQNYGVVFYEVRGRHYYAIPSWREHQKTETREDRRKYPPPDHPEAVPDLRFHPCADSAPDIRRETGAESRETVAGTGEQGNRGTEESSSLTLVEGGVGGDPHNLPAVAHSAPGAPAAKAPRGSRLPDGWMPDDETIAAMRQQFPHVDLRAEHEKFTDYWRGVAGAKGRKADWTATWRNWIRRAAENAPRMSASAPAASNGLGKPSQKALGWEKAGEALIAELEGRR